MSELSLDSRLMLSPEIVSQELEGELVILSLDRAEYFGLNPSGTKVWQGLAAGASLHAVAADIAAEFGIETERACEDVLALARALLDEGLATLQDAADRP